MEMAGRRTTKWAWVPLVYVGLAVATAVALKLLGKPQWFALVYWVAMPALFLIECALLHQRLGGGRRPAARYIAVILAAAFMTLLTAYVAVTIVFNVFGPLGWI
jgi:uncharacterized membrane protein YhaH (DUF805 family)